MKVIKFLGVLVGLFFAVILAALIAIGYLAPETYIYPGTQVPGKYLNKLNSLGLLEDGEQLKYFYSDALFSIEEGMYFVTDKKLVIYSNAWTDPEVILEYSEIKEIDVLYDDSFLNDTSVEIRTRDEFEYMFPISSEQGRDKDFIKYLAAKASKAKLTEETYSDL